VAVNALGSGTFHILRLPAVYQAVFSCPGIRLVKMMTAGIIDIRAMTLKTKLVIRLLGFNRM
jgi:hypothetical protein